MPNDSIVRPAVSVATNRNGGKTFKIDADHWKAYLLRTAKKSPAELASPEPIPLDVKIENMEGFIETRLSEIEASDTPTAGHFCQRLIDNGYLVWVTKLDAVEANLGF